MAKEKHDGPTPPKRPLSGFFFFKGDLFQATKEAHPDAKVTDITKIIAEKWRAVDEKTKKKYDDKQAAAKVQYEKDLKAWEAEHGSAKKAKAGKGKKGKGKKEESEEGSDSDDNKKKSKKNKSPKKK